MATVRTFKLEGLVPAVFTPMTPEGEVDYDKIDMYCQHLSNNGITQIYVNGTTGEGFSLTLEEREKIVEKWIEVGKKSGRIKSIVVQVGALNLHDTLAMVQHAVSVGADAIASVPPLFFKPNSVEYLIKYCKEVANAAPQMPFYFYHYPGATGVDHCVEDFLKVAAKEIPSLVGVKFSSKDLVDLIGCVHVAAPNRDDKKFNFLYGCDEKIMAGMIMGADGGVGSTYNFMATVIRKVLDNTEKGNITEARLHQYRTQQTCKAMYKYGDLLGHNVAALKAIMKLIDVDLGPPRLPMRDPTDGELMQFRKDLQDIGFFDWHK
ncbi:N-acetylneuraminate lyase-like [Mercenaria mercenaria]|uniref:N-acetylneuraminate lyase-like n=1 Tax=Mercenaria mercenaria TaxID=6596 RepID=UPI00234E3E3E|nr:N-acetylneuraminate lyase-like [Mercenaria mercenaria]